MVRVLAIIISIMGSVPVFAEIQRTSLVGEDSINEKTFIESLKTVISKNFNGASIEFTSPVKWIRGEGSLDPSSQITFLGSDSKGNAHFSISDSTANTSAEGWISFKAWLNAKIAIRRVRPNELLSDSLFITERINVANGTPYDYRGVIYPAAQDVDGLESIQTILEGNFLVSSSVQKVPDIRRGDSVRIHLISKGLTLTTQGVAEETAYIHRQLRVMAGKTKKELLGKLLPGGVVEVQL